MRGRFKEGRRHCFSRHICAACKSFGLSHPTSTTSSTPACACRCAAPRSCCSHSLPSVVALPLLPLNRKTPRLPRYRCGSGGRRKCARVLSGRDGEVIEEKLTILHHSFSLRASRRSRHRPRRTAATAFPLKDASSCSWVSSAAAAAARGGGGASAAGRRSGVALPLKIQI